MASTMTNTPVAMSTHPIAWSDRLCAKRTWSDPSTVGKFTKGYTEVSRNNAWLLLGDRTGAMRRTGATIAPVWNRSG